MGMSGTPLATYSEIGILPAADQDASLEFIDRALTLFGRVKQQSKDTYSEVQIKTIDEGWFTGIWYQKYKEPDRNIGTWQGTVFANYLAPKQGAGGRTSLTGGGTTSESTHGGSGRESGTSEDTGIFLIKNYEEIDKSFPDWRSYAEHITHSAAEGKKILQGETVALSCGTDINEYNRFMVSLGTLIADQIDGEASPAIFARYNNALDERLNAGFEQLVNVREGMDGAIPCLVAVSGSPDSYSTDAAFWFSCCNTIALASSSRYGFLDEGFGKHEIKKNSDGESIRAACITSKALFSKNAHEEAPLLFEDEVYEYGASGSGSMKHVMLRYFDPLVHEFEGGQKMGKFIWVLRSDSTPPLTPPVITPTPNRTPPLIPVPPVGEPGVGAGGVNPRGGGQIDGASGGDVGASAEEIRDLTEDKKEDIKTKLSAHEQKLRDLGVPEEYWKEPWKWRGYEEAARKRKENQRRLERQRKAGKVGGIDVVIETPDNVYAPMTNTIQVYEPLLLNNDGRPAGGLRYDINIGSTCFRCYGAVANKYSGQDGYDWERAATDWLQSQENQIEIQQRNPELWNASNTEIIPQVIEHLKEFYHEPNKYPEVGNFNFVAKYALITDTYALPDYNYFPGDHFQYGTTDGMILLLPPEMSSYYYDDGMTLSSTEFALYNTIPMGWLSTIDNTCTMQNQNSAYFLPTIGGAGEVDLDLYFHDAGGARDGDFTVHGNINVTGTTCGFWSRDNANTAVYPATAGDDIWLPDDDAITFGNTRVVPDASMYWESANNRLRTTAVKTHHWQSYTDITDHRIMREALTYRSTGVNVCTKNTYAKSTSLRIYGSANNSGQNISEYVTAYNYNTAQVSNIYGANYQLLNYSATGTLLAGYGLNLDAKNVANGSNSTSLVGGQFRIQNVGIAANIGTATAGHLSIENLGANTTIANAISNYAYTRNIGAGAAITNAYSTQNLIENRTGNITTAYLNYSKISQTGIGGAIATAYGDYYANPVVTNGAITNYTALYIEHPTTAGTNIPIYVADGVNESYLGGNYRIPDDRELRFGNAAGGDADLSYNTGANQLKITTTTANCDILLNANRHTRLDDDKQLRFGTDGDVYQRYVSADNEFEIGTGTAGSHILLNAQSYTKLNDGKIFAFGTGNEARMSYSAAGAWQHQILEVGATWDLLMWNAAGSLKNRLNFTSTEAILNDSGEDIDTRIETDGDTHMLFAEGSTNRLGISTAAPIATFDCDGDLVAGDTSGGNYTKIAAATGHQTMVGDARPYNDIPFSIYTGKDVGVNTPTDAAFQGSIKQFTFDIDDTMQLGCSEIPHSYENGTDLEMHVHVALNGSDAGNTYLNFQIEYSVVVSGIYTNGTLTSGNYLIPGGSADRKEFTIPMSALVDGENVVLGTGSILKVTRIALVAPLVPGDGPTDDPFVTMAGIHIINDKLGTNVIYP